MPDDFQLKMCELFESDTNHKRRRNKAHLMLSIMLNSWPYHPNLKSYKDHDLPTHVAPSSPIRRVCLLTTLLAFIIGILVGVFIPLYLMPLRTTPPKMVLLENASVFYTHKENYNVSDTVLKSESLPHVDFPSVSFVAKAVIMPDLLRKRLYGEEVIRLGGVADPDADHDAGADADLAVVTNGVYWDARVENLLPQGFANNDSVVWRRFARHTPVIKVEEGCGRMQNRLLTFEDGTKSCCRYRQNTDQIQGELFSYYLGTLLKLRNLAPSSLALVKLSSPLFNKVKPQLNLAQWAEDRAVVLTKFVSKLEPANIPAGLRKSGRRLHPPDVEHSSKEELIELVQWSDLIIFDYLTANLDRVVNNLYNQQWNAAMMDSPAHNLARDPTTGLLVFFDNESGLLHGYRLLDKYEHYHIALLDALCVFRKSTADVIKQLHMDKNVGDLIQELFKSYDPDFKEVLPTLPEKSVKILNERIDRVYDQITMCERDYPKQT